MLIIFIIFIVGIIAVCDFSGIFLDEDLEDILYYRDDEEVEAQTEEVISTYETECEDEPEVVEEKVVHEEDDTDDDLPEVKTVSPEDDFDEYDDFNDFAVTGDTDNLDKDSIDTEDILQQIIRDSEII